MAKRRAPKKEHHVPVLPNRVQEFMDARGWGVRDVAARCTLSSSTVHRLATRAAHLRQYDMRELAKAFEVKPSAFLPDEDVELRADESAAAIIKVLHHIAPDDRPAVLSMARDMAEIAERTAVHLNAEARRISGDPEIIRQLAEFWNSVGEEAKPEVVTLLNASGYRRSA